MVTRGKFIDVTHTQSLLHSISTTVNFRPGHKFSKCELRKANKLYALRNSRFASL